MTEPAADLLLECLHRGPERMTPHRLSALTAVEWQRLLAAARAHHLQPLLLARLQSRGLDRAVPEPALTALRDASRRSLERNVTLLVDLDRAAAALHAAGIAVIVLKGAHLAHAVYANLALRSMSDIDLLVPAAGAARAGAALEALGYAPLAPYDGGADVTAAFPYHLPRFVRQGSVGIEVHWTLAPPNPLCDVADLWARAVPLRLGARSLLALSPEDLLLHLCAHASHKHRFEMGLRPSCDVAALVDRHGARLDWPAVVDRARRWQWDRGIYLSLRLAADLLGAAVPDGVLEALRPAGFDDALVQTAREVTLLDGGVHRDTPLSLVTMTGAASPARRVAALWRRIFLPPADLAEVYAVPAGSRRVLFYYPRRAATLLTRHGRVALRLLRGDPRLTRIAAQKIAIEDWLARHE